MVSVTWESRRQVALIPGEGGEWEVETVSSRVRPALARAEGVQAVVRTERQVRRGKHRLIEWELSEPLILRRAVTEGGGQRSR